MRTFSRPVVKRPVAERPAVELVMGFPPWNLGGILPGPRGL